MENEGKTWQYELLHYGNKKVHIFLGIRMSNMFFIVNIMCGIDNRSMGQMVGGLEKRWESPKRVKYVLRY